jgi:hypothetical protein
VPRRVAACPTRSSDRGPLKCQRCRSTQDGGRLTADRNGLRQTPARAEGPTPPLDRLARLIEAYITKYHDIFGFRVVDGQCGRGAPMTRPSSSRCGPAGIRLRQERELQPDPLALQLGPPNTATTSARVVPPIHVDVVVVGGRSAGVSVVQLAIRHPEVTAVGARLRSRIRRGNEARRRSPVARAGRDGANPRVTRAIGLAPTEHSLG